MAVVFRHGGPPAALRGRQLVTRPVAEFLATELIAANGATRAAARADTWAIDLGADLLFDREGLGLIAAALEAHRGGERALRVVLEPDPRTHADYYSLHESLHESPHDSLHDSAQDEAEPARRIPLPILARREDAGPETAPEGDLILPLPAHQTWVPFPESLTAPGISTIPEALLLSYRSDFDLLFANQIAVLGDISRRVRRSPLALLGALAPRQGVPWRMRAALAFAGIHRSAQVHPTAVIEGSVIGAGARIGAHCVVRFSHVAAGARLHDGAKAEYSTIGEGSWLMHDLVLYRCHVEEQVFLIHGPYQFSQFESRSSAFATILMDYRPDGRPIRVATPDGPRLYRGRFLGCVLKSGAKTLGGSLVAPGRIIAADTWLAADPAAIHVADQPDAEMRRPLAPRRPEART